MFDLIKNITLDKSSWDDKLFITSDIDWASDEVLDFVINLFDKHNLKCTFFATHKTTLLDSLGANYEVGLHPNFNYLLNGDFRYGKNYKEVIDYYYKMFPTAKSVRSHSMTQNTLILDEFARLGFTHDCNHFIPYKNSETKLEPWKYWQDDMLKVPYLWEDDIHCVYQDKWEIDLVTKISGLKVLDFHPIHIFLNTEDIERYNSARLYLQSFKELQQFVNTTKYGTRDFLLDLF